MDDIDRAKKTIIHAMKKLKEEAKEIPEAMGT